MFNKSYSNFVRACADEEIQCPTASLRQTVLSGEEARRLYLEEIKNAKTKNVKPTNNLCTENLKKQRIEEEIQLNDKDIFLSVQNNDVEKVRLILDKYPDKLSLVDDYGWSLLMIACQANSIETTKELLNRGIDISLRDKAGNSARSLVIKNKNYELASVLLTYKETEQQQCINQDRIGQTTRREEYVCDVCNKTFPDREEHLSSTLHNICASKGKKIRAHYVIPASNKGYQLMLKGGWDRDSGLGRDGSGKKYPIKTIQKKDRKGLGHKKSKQEEKIPENSIKVKCKKMFENNYRNNRNLEINFRREFY